MSKFTMTVLAIISPIAFTLAWENTVCDTSGLQLFPGIVSEQDADGGAIVYWIDNRAGHYEVYAKRIKGTDGSTYGQWPAQGKDVSTPPLALHGHRLSPVAACGSQGQIILAWVNHHNLDPYKQGIYVTKLDANNGSLLWNDDLVNNKGGKFISSSTNPVSLCSDGAGGCIIAALLSDGMTIKAYKLLSDGSFAGGNWHGNQGLTIASGTNQLGNPRLAVVDTFVVVVYDESEYNERVQWKPDSGGSSYLRAAKLDKSSGSVIDTLTLEQRSNTHICDPGPAETQGKRCSPYWWDYLDYPLAVSGDSLLYIGEWVAMRLRSWGEWRYYHANCLVMRLSKLNVTSWDYESFYIDSVPYGALCPFDTSYMIDWRNQGCTIPIEDFTIRAPVIAARSDGGAVVVYTTNPDYSYQFSQNS